MIQLPIRRFSRPVYSAALATLRDPSRAAVWRGMVNPVGIKPARGHVQGGRSPVRATGPRQSWRSWSGRRDSNPRPPGPKPGALPGCATTREMEPPAGFEPAAFRLQGGCSTTEPQGRIDGDQASLGMVGPAGFEPVTSCSRSRRAPRLRHDPSMVPPARVELATCRVRSGCSATELQGRRRGSRCDVGVEPKELWCGRPGRGRWVQCSGAADAPWNMVVGTAGFEPAASSPPDWRATRLRYAPVVLVGATRFEAATSGFGDRRSST